MAGDVRRVIMGLDRHKKTPCGFCFVEYYEKSAARIAVNYINGTKLDGRIVRTDWDAGFKEGRQYGRGRRGGQVSVILVFVQFMYFLRLGMTIAMIMMKNVEVLEEDTNK